MQRVTYNIIVTIEICFINTVSNVTYTSARASLDVRNIVYHDARLRRKTVPRKIK